MEKETLKLIKSIINDGSLSKEDEDEIIRSLSERKNGRGNKRCIAAAIEAELRRAESLDAGKVLICQELLRKCFKNSEVGNMDASELTVTKIKEYMEETCEMQHLDNKEIQNFAKLLQIGLKKLHREGVLQFIPEDEMIRKYLDSKNVLNYIGNPYTDEETEKILKWAEEHPADIKACAVGLIFLGGISFSEASELTVRDCWENRDGAYGVERPLGRMFYEDRRCRIVQNALNSHPVVLGYVFAVPRLDGKGWDKLNARGIAKKLSSICREIGIQYKKIYKNEVIMIKKQADRI